MDDSYCLKNCTLAFIPELVAGDECDWCCVCACSCEFKCDHAAIEIRCRQIELVKTVRNLRYCVRAICECATINRALCCYGQCGRSGYVVVRCRHKEGERIERRVLFDGEWGTKIIACQLNFGQHWNHSQDTREHYDHLIGA